MKVSIITSCFNRAATIRGAIESVLAQDYNNIEFIVVDGASTDGSLEIIREYEGRISTIISEPDHGMYEAINKGIRVATGDVIGLLHSDDFFYDNGVISRIVEHMKTTRADFLYGDGLFVNPDNTDKIFLYMALFSASGAAITWIDGITMKEALFETASAIGTVGVPLGVTPFLRGYSHLILICRMFFGRVGGLTLLLSLRESKAPDLSLIHI